MADVIVQKRKSNTHFLDVIQASISTLAPVHLGSGEDFLPTNYVIDAQGWLHSFNEMSLAQALGSDLKQISALVNKERNSDKLLLSIQKLIHNQSNTLRGLAQHSIPVASGIAQLYHDRIGKVAQHESNNRQVINRLEIMRTFINPHSYMPIITGSAIKGAIRTAVLNQLAKNKGWQKPDDVRDAKKLQQNLLEYQKMNEDPFKLLKISDAPYHNDDNLLASEILFAVSKRRQAKYDRNGNLRTAGGPTTNLEAISPFRYRSFDFDIRLWDNPSQDAKHKLPTDIQQLAQLCNSYYLPKLEKELLELGRNNSFLDEAYVDGIDQLLEGELGQALQQNKAFLLNLGKHGGAFNKTLDNLRQIRMPKSNQPASEPSEKRLAATQSKQDTDLLPFGWVVVQLDGLDLPDLKAFMHSQATARHAYTKRDELVQLHIAQKETQAQIAQEQKMAQLEKEKKQQEDAKEKERLANMSEQQRAIEQLRQEFAKGWKLDLQHPLIQQLSQLIENDAVNWSDTDKAELLELAKVIYKSANIDIKKNKKVAGRLKLLK